MTNDSELGNYFENLCGEELWNITKLLNSTVPNFSQCAQHTVFIWIPVIFVLLCTPLQLYACCTSKGKPLSNTKLVITKLLTFILLMVICLCQIIFGALNKDTFIWIIYPILLFCAMSISCGLYVLCLRKGLHTSGVLFNALLLFFIAGIPEYRYWIEKDIESRSAELFYCVSFLCYYNILFIATVLQIFADKVEYPTGVDPKKVCPETRSSYFNQLVFWWFNPLVISGFKHDLELEELWLLNYEDMCRSQVPKWDKEWLPAMAKHKTTISKNKIQNKLQFRNSKENEEVKILRGDRKPISNPPSIVWALWKVYKWKLVTSVFMKLLFDALSFSSPQLLKLLIRYVSTPSLPLWLGLFYSGVIFFIATFSTFLLQQYFHLMYSLGMNIRTVLVSAIFTKSLNISNSVRKEYTVGEIVNLMSVDCQRFQDTTNRVNLIWSCPLQVIVSLVFLWGILGPSVLVGVALLIVMMPMNYYLAKKNQEYQAAQMEFKDERVKLMNEVLNGMKVLKLYAWEPSFEKMIHDIRLEELKVLRKAAYLSAISNFNWMCAPLLVSIGTFAAFVLSDEKNILTPETAFVSLALFNILRFPFAILPGLITTLVQAIVSNKRLKKFLASDELNLEAVTKIPKGSKDLPAILVENASFTWDKFASDNSMPLKNISVQVDQGALVALVGTVGSGKSSMLNALLGEMDVVEGNVTLSGSVSYVPQQAWIQNMSLRHNITFMKDFDQQWYDKVVEACALKTDFDILPAGDQTEIGEKGINLSGGQKQRVSLARAVYQNTDIYLLDDPLSAVDSHVGKHIFDKVIGPEGLLKHKAVLMVTNGLNYLKHCHKIIVLASGTISEMGSYTELMESHGAFAQFLETYLLTEAIGKENVDENALEEELGIIHELEKYDSTARKRLQSHVSPVAAVHSTNPVIDGSVQKRAKAGRSDRAEARTVKEIQTPAVINKAELIKVETSETGRVKMTVYLVYIRAIGHMVCLSHVIFLVVSSGASIGSNIWLADWSDDSSHLLLNESLNVNIETRIAVYAGLGFIKSVIVFIATMILAFGMVLASTHLHQSMISNLLRSPMSFYDITPLGRILNRCGKDINAVDNVLPEVIRVWLCCFFTVLETLTIICISTPLFAAFIPPLAIIYFLVLRFYVSTSRQLKRLESVTRSPIYSHFQEAVQGASSIRAYGVMPQFIVESHNRIDTNMITYYPNITSNRWLAIRLEFVGNCIVLLAALFAVIYREDGVTAGLVGLSVSYALSVTQELNWTVRMTSELESNIVAVERIKEYSETPQEANWASAANMRPPKNWPDKGEVKLDKYATRYRDCLDLVLKDITCEIKPEEHVGIVGRTGAGKSSLTLALFRIIEPSGGKIVIDGRDITQMGLHELRSKLTIIPQDPVLFSGTLRMNLDPFDKYSDAELWTALEHAHLKEFVQGFNSALLYPVSEGGENLSVGQRQLVCLARALLRKTKVLILDEATAAVDMETDQLIQNTIKTEFSDCTIITIAHRINTILDCDRILVLEHGNVAEFESPKKLLVNTKSIFYAMAKDAGIVSSL